MVQIQPWATISKKTVRKGTLIQVRLSDSEVAKLDNLAAELGGKRTHAIKFLISKLDKLEIIARTAEGGAK